MNRPIKFRAWYKKGKLMIQPEVIFGSIDSDGISVFDMALGNEDYVLMQFTGLPDKNGKDIYEGDIVKSIMGGREIVGVMYFKASRAQFGIDHVVDTTKKVPEHVELHSPPEVIGNIFENPELLKSNDKGNQV